MVKEYLEAVRKDYLKIEIKKRQMYVMRSKLLQGVNFDEKTSSTMPSDQTNKITITVMELEKELNEQIESILERRVTATRMICSISNPYAMEIVSKRYLENMEWEQIQKEVCYSYRQMFRLCKEAYDELEKGGTKWH